MQQESTKKEYGQHVHDGVFTLILSTTGEMGRKATPFYKSLADGISKGGFAAACMSCNGNFGPAKELVRGDQNSRNNGPPGPFSPGNLVRTWNNQGG